MIVRSNGSGPVAIEPRGEDATIEALRGFAALIVVAVHYAHLVNFVPGPWAFASTGIDLFFVLSGFVFGPYFFGRPLAWWPHYVRRFFRIYPLYLAALATYFVLKLPDPLAWRFLPDHLFMLHTMRSLEIAFYFNAAFWSLPPELEFYLVLPLIAMLLQRRGFTLLLVAAAAMHMALIAVGRAGGAGLALATISSVHLPGLLVEFALGAGAWRLASSGGARGLRIALGLLELAGMAFVYARFIAVDPAAAPQAWPWISGNIGVGAAVGYALVVSGIAGRPNPQGWKLAACLLAGDLSYGVYLFHNALPHARAKFGWPIEGWVAVAVCLAATVAIAWVLHRVLEAPARRFGRELSRRIAARQRA